MEIDRHLNDGKRGEMIRTGINVVIVGMKSNNKAKLTS
jgi:hypothetical protein